MIADPSGEHCVETVERVCVIVEPGTPPPPPDPEEVLENPPADADVTRDCPRSGYGVNVTILDGRALVCAALILDITPNDPKVTIEPPSVDTSGVIPDGQTSIAGCGSAHGGRVLVLGNGATVCIEVEVGTGGRDLHIDLTPCPNGADPRVEVLGVIVQVCVVVIPHTNPPKAPEVEPGDVDVDIGEVMPSVRLEPCPRGGADPGVRALGLVVELCLAFQVDPPGPQADRRSCDDGRSGQVFTLGDSAVGACIG